MTAYAVEAGRRAWSTLPRARAGVENVHPAKLLVPAILVQWLSTLALALTVRHNGWLFYQGGDQLWYYVSGWLLAFITSFDELTMSVFIANPSTTTLPVRMFLQIQDTIDPMVAAVSALLIAGTLVVMLVLDRMVGLERLFVGKSRR